MKAGETDNRSEEVAISQPSDTGTATAEKQAAHKLPRYGGLRP